MAQSIRPAVRMYCCRCYCCVCYSVLDVLCVLLRVSPFLEGKRLTILRVTGRWGSSSDSQPDPRRAARDRDIIFFHRDFSLGLCARAGRLADMPKYLGLSSGPVLCQPRGAVTQPPLRVALATER